MINDSFDIKVVNWNAYFVNIQGVSKPCQSMYESLLKTKLKNCNLALLVKEMLSFEDGGDYGLNIGIIFFCFLMD